MATTTQRTTVTHPYSTLGVIVMIAALVLVAFDLGILARCGAGEGLCFDAATHGTSDGALVAFFILFFVGLTLVLYTDTGTSVTRSESPRPSAPQVLVVNPAAPASVTVNANPPAPVSSPTVVTVRSP